MLEESIAGDLQASEGIWMKKETTKQPFITLFNLAPEETYIFRVRADNAFGQSDPSEESEPIYVKVNLETFRL